MWLAILCAALTLLAWGFMILGFFRFVIFIVSWWFYAPSSDEEQDNTNLDR
jgi:hypothetical protein